EDVRAKQHILRILDTSSIEMVISVPESAISLVPYVMDATCQFDAFPDRPIPAEVKEIGVEASRNTRTYPVTLLMKQPEDIRILPGMAGRATGRVEMPKASEQQGVDIAESALLERDGKRYVWVVQSGDGKTGTTELREVELGELSARGLRNVKGLESGEVIVTAGAFYLSSGQEVRIADDPS
ncbi:MAG: efflux RND transporter periplasmic adaptor subunit, partial [Aeoliella sp.]